MISKTHQFHPINKTRNIFNKIKSTNIRLLMRNDLNNWVEVSLFIQLTNQNRICWLHYTNLQNKTQCRRCHFFCGITKKLA